MLIVERDLARVLGLTRLLDRTRHQPRIADVLWQVVGRRVLAVVDDPRHQRPVEIAVHIGHQHLLPDPRHREHAPTLARPRLRHSNPARRVRFHGLVAVPVEMHLDPPKPVGVHLRHLRPHHRRALDTRHLRPLRREQRPVWLVIGQRTELHPDVAPLRRAVRTVLDEHQLAADHVIAPIARDRRVAHQRERLPRREAARVRLADQHMCIGLERLQPQPRKTLSVLLVLIARRIVVVLQLHARQRRLRRRLRVAVQTVRRHQVVEVPQRDVVRAHPARPLQSLYPLPPLDRPCLLAVRQVLKLSVRKR
ncbi:hypothetical protein BSE24067_07196 [Burkholderia seminalis]|nr:hypothetical protein BSE24067_07196 [Burkholderia seminalis]